MYFSPWRAKESYYSEPYQPYVYCPACLSCLREKKGFVRLRAEGKEGKNYKLYVRFVCPINPNHSDKEWMYHTKRPWKFRIKKMIMKLYS